MEEFLANPNEVTAAKMFENETLPNLIRSCQSSEQAIEFLRLSFQLNNFNVFTQLGTPGLVELLNVNFLQRLTLEHLKYIEFPPNDYSAVVSQLFSIFTSEDIGCSNLAKDLLVHKLGNSVSQENYCEKFRDLLESNDSIIKIRALELVIELANQYNFEVFDRSGLIDLGIEMVTGNDILLKIVAIEVIAELGNSDLGCKKLLGEKIRKVIKAAIEEDEEIHIRNKLILLSCKVFHFTGNDMLIDGKFWEVLLKMLGSNDPSSVKNALGGISLLATRLRGVQMVFEKPEIVQAWARLQRSVNSTIKAMFYHTFAEVTALFSEEHMVEYSRISNYIPPIIDELVNPFQDTHADMLKSIVCIVKWRSQAFAFTNESKFKEYLLKRPPHQTHEVSCLKYDIVIELNKHDLPLPFKEKIEKYLKAGVFAAESELDMELDSKA